MNETRIIDAEKKGEDAAADLETSLRPQSLFQSQESSSSGQTVVLAAANWGQMPPVFAERSEGDERFFDRRCSRTKLMKAEYGDLKEDLKKLGEAKTCIDLEKNN